MTEEKTNGLRQSDKNLRDALRQDEAERPLMPANLNERLMKRVANEEKKPRRIIWPWIAAACVAGVMMIWLTPPKKESSPLIPLQEAKVTVNPGVENVCEPMIAMVETEAQQPVVTPTKEMKPKVRRQAEESQTKLVAQETPVTETASDETSNDLAVAETAVAQEKPVILTERDIPLTRPENYEYTPEEIALMKKQANEAYLKWAQLELEIARHNLEQTAQK